MNVQSTAESIRSHPLLTVPSATTVAKTGRRVHRGQVGAGLPKVADGAVSGLFTEGDATCALAKGVSADGPVEAAMTCAPANPPARREPMDPPRLVQDRGFRQVPLMDGRDAVGVVSRGDFRTSELDRPRRETGFRERP